MSCKKLLLLLGFWILCTIIYFQYALKRRITSGSEREHWLDYAKEKYDNGIVEDVKCLLRVLWMYLPLPMFWALFDQLVISWYFLGNCLHNAAALVLTHWHSFRDPVGLSKPHGWMDPWALSRLNRTRCSCSTRPLYSYSFLSSTWSSTRHLQSKV